MAETKRTILLEYDVKTGKLIDENGKVIKSIDELGKSYKQTKKATEDLGKATDDYSKKARTLNKLQEDQARSSGLAGAAAFELGRTISDLPFGLVAISNNISQLGTIMAALVANAGSLKRALVLLKRQLIGPAGILIAFQAVVAAVTFYTQRAARATKETNDFNKSLADLNTEVLKLSTLAEIVKDNSSSLEQQENALKALKNKGFDPAIQSIDEFIEAQQRLAISRALSEMFAQDIAKLEKERLDILQESRELLTDYLLAIEEGDTFRASIISAQIEKVRENVKRIEQEVSDSQGRLKSLFKDGDLVDFLFGGKENGVDQLEKKTREKTKKLIAVFYGTTFQELEKRKKEAEEIRQALGIETIEETLGKSGAAVAEEFMQNFGEGIEILSDDVIDKSTVTLEDKLKVFAKGIGTIGDLLSSQSDREIAIEVNKTNALNDQLKIRLANEQMTADQRDKINQEIARNEATLVEKENKINKKRFEQQKAANIAIATIDTYVAANQALKNPLELNPVAKFASVALVIAAGLANVATIARQQFVAQAMPSPRLSGLGVSESETSGPSFNVVGGTIRNQVAEAVRDALSQQPIKTYVVSSDVTTAQQLERNIVEGASI